MASGGERNEAGNLGDRTDSDLSRRLRALFLSASPTSTSEGAIPRHVFPRDVVGPLTPVPKVKIPDSVTAGCYAEVHVGDIDNPEKFYVFFRDIEHSGALQRLMYRLQEFYKNRRDAYRLHPDGISVGQDCVALFGNVWQRARITDFGDEDSVDVFFYDCGGSRTVHNDEIYYLHSAFGKLPAQAVKASLANIKPAGAAGTAWSEAATHRFFRLVQNKPLVALVLKLDARREALDLVLCDTNTTADIYVNDLLVEEGLAQFRVKPRADVD